MEVIQVGFTLFLESPFFFISRLLAEIAFALQKEIIAGALLLELFVSFDLGCRPQILVL